jgi:hypothetical protein
MLTDRPLLPEMGRAGREFVEGWASPAAVARSYEQLFLELVGRRRHRHRRPVSGALREAVFTSSGAS